MIKFAKLPPDMQVLVSDYIGAPIGDPAIPEQLPVIDVRLADLPVVPLCEYDRGTLYARRMTPDNTPPIIIADNQFLDGKHRRFSFLELGLESIPAIDLTGLADPQIVKFCSMGKIGAGVAYEPEHECPDRPEFLVWDYANSGFATKNNGYSAHPNDACELSPNQIAERYSRADQYLIFPYLYFVDIQTTLRIERGTPELLARGIVGWAWQIDTPNSLGGEWYDCESAKDAVEAARLYVTDRLVGVRVPEPETLLALDNPCITDALEATPLQAVKRQSFESVLGF